MAATGSKIPIPPGYWGNLSAEQQEKLVSLRDLVKDVVPDPATVPKNGRRYDDPTLVRFLRARAWDVQKAADMIKEDAWRKKEGMDTLVDTLMQTSKWAPLLDKYWPLAIHGQDRRGGVLKCSHTPKIDPRSVFSVVPPQEMIRFHLYTQEKCDIAIREAAERLGCGSDMGMCFVDDASGLAWRHTHAISNLRACSALDVLHYPEMVYKLYIVNAPTLFKFFWRLIRPMVDPSTLEKIDILGYDWKDTVSKYIDPVCIPVESGGSCTLHNGACLPPGGIFSGKASTEDEDSYTTLSIPAGVFHEVEIRSEVDGSSLVWEFTTEDYDVGFAVFQKHENDKKEIHPYSRIQANDEPHQGQVMLSSAGSYLLHFDNSYSNFRKKQVNYRFAIEVPVSGEDK